MQKNSFSKIPGRDINDMNSMPEEKSAVQDSRIHNGEGLQNYCFEFIGEQKYSIFFKGHLTRDDIHSILIVLHSRLYKDCPETIRSYLEQHHLEYSHFRTEISLPDHEEVMNWAEELLNSGSCDKIDSHIGRVDNYYAVADYQKQLSGGGCEGCYYAVQKTTDHKNCSYHIIGQTFATDKCDDSFHGYFAVRTNQNSRQIRNLDVLSGEPVLPVFGCVDMAAVLMDIESLVTAKQVIKTVLK